MLLSDSVCHHCMCSLFGVDLLIILLWKIELKICGPPTRDRKYSGHCGLAQICSDICILGACFGKLLLMAHCTKAFCGWPVLAPAHCLCKPQQALIEGCTLAVISLLARASLPAPSLHCVMGGIDIDASLLHFACGHFDSSIILHQLGLKSTLISSHPPPKINRVVQQIELLAFWAAHFAAACMLHAAQ